ncbi:MAG TPA: bifunctional 3,4-dihydroxy-2-butanone-4-phosphate synthase/GTP cyclohydrolase II, partial [Gammaproteobacteria bacterium]
QDEPPREVMSVLRGLEQPEHDVIAPRDGTTELRTFGIGAQILRSLGVKRMRVLSAPKHMHALSGFGLEVVEYVSPDSSGEG